MGDPNDRDNELRAKLNPMQYYVTQQCGTERPFTGKYWNHKEKGTYLCVSCGEKLFPSESKYDSGSGWPSYYAPLAGAPITEQVDDQLGQVRTEVRCGSCGAHLGHVFEDGPDPTGLRYCINSAALDFEGKDDPGP
jgi:peptide-methionine (R)-S-oxide reductase